MDTNKARRMALDLMAQHGVTGRYQFKWDRAKSRLGLTRHDKGTISLSFSYVQSASEDNVRNTILHEIAHAMVGPGHGHGNVWRRQFLAIGGNGARTGEREADLRKTFVVSCPACGPLGTVKGHRMPRRYSNSRCRTHQLPVSVALAS